LLWTKLRSRQLLGAKFVRQFPVGGYIADFACREHGLIVELDGSQHHDSEYDVERTAKLEALGYRMRRFWKRDVLENLDGVVLASEVELLVAIQRWDDRRKAGIGERTADD
jgi:very-short-patch-repair endonuclease